jgi:FMN reductase [NAD(P)H]
MNPERIKMNFPPNILRKFSLQDATLAAAYAQLAAHALGLSSIWIGMIDEEKIMAILDTKYIPSSILCLGYPQRLLQPKPKRNLIDLIHEV